MLCGLYSKSLSFSVSVFRILRQLRISSICKVYKGCGVTVNRLLPLFTVSLFFVFPSITNSREIYIIRMCRHCVMRFVHKR